MGKKRTILLVDDHTLFREGLKAIIRRHPDYEVVAEAGRGDAALRLARELRPHLALIDISLPDQSGIDVTLQLKRAVPRTAVLIVTMHSKIDYIVSAFRAGATGFVTKDSAPERLLQAIEIVLQGETFLDSAVSQQVLARLTGVVAAPGTRPDAAYETLTPREQEIFALLAEGHPARHIAERLFISPKTVENHRTRILQKLGLRNSLELIRYAARVGVIDLDLWKE
ncbi:MAG: response regulator transcription factor [Desulfobacterales bacterium]